MSDQTPPQVNITSHHQSGGITAQNVTVIAPSPSVDVEVVKKNEQTDAGFLTEALVKLQAQQAIQGLTVQVRGKSILNFQANPVYSAIKVFGTVVGPNGNEPPWTSFKRSWAPPLDSAYLIKVWTAEPESLEVRAEPT